METFKSKVTISLPRYFHSGSFRSILFSLTAFLTVAFCLEPAFAQDSCLGDKKNLSFSEVYVFEGYSMAALNAYGEFVLAVDYDSESTTDLERGEADLVVRIATDGEIQKIISRWETEPRYVRIISRKAPGYHEIELSILGNVENVWAFDIDRDGCGQAYAGRAQVSSEYRLEASGLALDMVKYEAASVPVIISAYKEYPAVSAPLASSHNSYESNLRIFSGGPGSQSCSISSPGFGPIGGSECSISCGSGAFALCGLNPIIGPMCTCMPSFGGAPGGDGGSDGSDTGGAGSGGQEDECDQDDPPESCDDSEGDDEGIGKFSDGQSKDMSA